MEGILIFLPKTILKPGAKVKNCIQYGGRVVSFTLLHAFLSVCNFVTYTCVVELKLNLSASCRRQKLHTERKACKSVKTDNSAAILCAFFLLWLPVIIYVFYEHIYLSNNRGLKVRLKTMRNVDKLHIDT